MALTVRTTQQIADDNLSNLESNLGQNSPLNDKSFLQVLSVLEALNSTELYKLAIERSLQNLALTATGSDLDAIGENYGIIRKAAEATVLSADLNGTDGVMIPAGTEFNGDSNNLIYTVDTTGTISGGVVSLSMTASQTGTVGNIAIGDTLSIVSSIANAESTATVTSIDNTGADEETDDEYRIRILDQIRNVRGGGNSADYRAWSEEVAGVFRAYPYSGKPFDSNEATAPPDRTVYVQVDTSIDPDGIAPVSILDEVRDSITTDPDTGIARQPLGLTDDTLYVESITRIDIFTEIRGLVVDSTLESQLMTDIDSALTTYYYNLQPYVDGLDFAEDRNDLITDLTISDIVQDVLKSYGASAEGVGFGLSVGNFLSSYQLNPGQTVKNGGVTYA